MGNTQNTTASSYICSECKEEINVIDFIKSKPKTFLTNQKQIYIETPYGNIETSWETNQNYHPDCYFELIRSTNDEDAKLVQENVEKTRKELEDKRAKVDKNDTEIVNAVKKFEEAKVMRVKGVHGAKSREVPYTQPENYHSSSGLKTEMNSEIFIFENMVNHKIGVENAQVYLKQHYENYSFFKYFDRNTKKPNFANFFNIVKYQPDNSTGHKLGLSNKTGIPKYYDDVMRDKLWGGKHNNHQNGGATLGPLLNEQGRIKREFNVLDLYEILFRAAEGIRSEPNNDILEYIFNLFYDYAGYHISWEYQYSLSETICDFFNWMDKYINDSIDETLNTWKYDPDDQSWNNYDVNHKPELFKRFEPVNFSLRLKDCYNCPLQKVTEVLKTIQECVQNFKILCYEMIRCETVAQRALVQSDQKENIPLDVKTINLYKSLKCIPNGLMCYQMGGEGIPPKKPPKRRGRPLQGSVVMEGNILEQYIDKNWIAVHLRWWNCNDYYVKTDMGQMPDKPNKKTKGEAHFVLNQLLLDIEEYHNKKTMNETDGIANKMMPPSAIVRCTSYSHAYIEFRTHTTSPFEITPPRKFTLGVVASIGKSASSILFKNNMMNNCGFTSPDGMVQRIMNVYKHKNKYRWLIRLRYIYIDRYNQITQQITQQPSLEYPIPLINYLTSITHMLYRINTEIQLIDSEARLWGDGDDGPETMINFAYFDKISRNDLIHKFKFWSDNELTGNSSDFKCQGGFVSKAFDITKEHVYLLKYCFNKMNFIKDLDFLGNKLIIDETHHDGKTYVYKHNLSKLTDGLHNASIVPLVYAPITITDGGGLSNFLNLGTRFAQRDIRGKGVYDFVQRQLLVREDRGGNSAIKLHIDDEKTDDRIDAWFHYYPTWLHCQDFAILFNHHPKKLLENVIFNGEFQRWSYSTYFSFSHLFFQLFKDERAKIGPRYVIQWDMSEHKHTHPTSVNNFHPHGDTTLINNIIHFTREFGELLVEFIKKPKEYTGLGGKKGPLRQNSFVKIKGHTNDKLNGKYARLIRWMAEDDMWECEVVDPPKELFISDLCHFAPCPIINIDFVNMTILSPQQELCVQEDEINRVQRGEDISPNWINHDRKKNLSKIELLNQHKTDKSEIFIRYTYQEEDELLSSLNMYISLFDGCLARRFGEKTRENNGEVNTDAELIFENTKKKVHKKINWTELHRRLYLELYTGTPEMLIPWGKRKDSRHYLHKQVPRGNHTRGSLVDEETGIDWGRRMLDFDMLQDDETDIRRGVCKCVCSCNSYYSCCLKTPMRPSELWEPEWDKKYNLDEAIDKASWVDVNTGDREFIDHAEVVRIKESVSQTEDGSMCWDCECTCPAEELSLPYIKRKYSINNYLRISKINIYIIYLEFLISIDGDHRHGETNNPIIIKLTEEAEREALEGEVVPDWRPRWTDNEEVLEEYMVSINTLYGELYERINGGLNQWKPPLRDVIPVWTEWDRHGTPIEKSRDWVKGEIVKFSDYEYSGKIAIIKEEPKKQLGAVYSCKCKVDDQVDLKEVISQRMDVVENEELTDWLRSKFGLREQPAWYAELINIDIDKLELTQADDAWVKFSLEKDREQFISELFSHPTNPEKIALSAERYYRSLCCYFFKYKMTLTTFEHLNHIVSEIKDLYIKIQKELYIEPGDYITLRDEYHGIKDGCKGWVQIVYGKNATVVFIEEQPCMPEEQTISDIPIELLQKTTKKHYEAHL